jgi:hypothetical protein
MRSAFKVCLVLAPESPLLVQVLHDDDLGLRSLSSFSSIGAMDEPKAALREAVELPMRYPELFRGSTLLQPVKVRAATCLRLLLNRTHDRGGASVWRDRKLNPIQSEAVGETACGPERLPCNLISCFQGAQMWWHCRRAASRCPFCLRKSQEEELRELLYSA